ncbi:glycerate kinase family protein [Acinetobacter bereziniae]|uniref:glycerate kinase family protein n=1 Tax=Acinetobacter bereziniae TaxID=106648 RepID=UPI00124F8ED2|nr:glycerate kinase [Acinetobacter bereziniae]MBJ9901101.1 glycerate kinase [Acinetobacter bereziniae]MCU4319094.1 glycerate kinase [Acinetobacter bereziniae]
MTKVFVLAPDSFKESMTAEQACFAMQRGIEKVIANAQFIHVPMADGGEGTVDALVAARDGRKVHFEVTGPLIGQNVQSYLGLIDDGKTAVIEMAMANGIHLIEKSQRNPLVTTTIGTGEMIKAALGLGVSKIIIGLGGSVTNDAGAGMAQALGAKFLDKNMHIVNVGGGQLEQIESIDISQLDHRLKQTEIIIASDVTNPLCGASGASYVFAPQKGATPEMVEKLDQNLKYFAELVKHQLNVDVADVQGAGAAGGLGFGLMVFTGAKIRSGVELVIEETQLAEKVAKADYVLTGEGGIDFQTKFGKTPFGVAQVAKKLNKPVIALAGYVGQGIEELYTEGFNAIFGIVDGACDLQTALKQGEKNLQRCCENVARLINL